MVSAHVVGRQRGIRNGSRPLRTAHKARLDAQPAQHVDHGARGTARAQHERPPVAGAQQRLYRAAEAHGVGVGPHKAEAGFAAADGNDVDCPNGLRLVGQCVQPGDDGLLMRNRHVQAAKRRVGSDERPQPLDRRHFKVDILGIDALAAKLLRKETGRKGVAQRVAQESVAFHHERALKMLTVK